MKYTSRKLGIVVNVPEGWNVVDRQDIVTQYLNMPPEQAALVAFIMLNIQNQSNPLYICATSDPGMYRTDTEYVSALTNNLDSLRQMGAEIITHETHQLPMLGKKNARVDRLVFKLNGIVTAQHFVFINNQLICFSCPINQSNDPLEHILYQIVTNIQVAS